MNTANISPAGSGWMDRNIYRKYVGEFMRENPQHSTPVRRKRPRVVKSVKVGSFSVRKSPR